MVSINKKKEELLSQEKLMSKVIYDSETGKFQRRVGYGLKEIGTLNPDGYVSFELFGYAYLAHRVAWLYVYGTWPDYQVDHINGNKSDNRISNLRLATNSLNIFSSSAKPRSSSGVRGVTFHEATGKWRARIRKDGKLYSLGLFFSKEEAEKAYQLKAEELFGQFARSA